MIDVLTRLRRALPGVVGGQREIFLAAIEAIEGRDLIIEGVSNEYAEIVKTLQSKLDYFQKEAAKDIDRIKALQAEVDRLTLALNEMSFRTGNAEGRRDLALSRLEKITRERDDYRAATSEVADQVVAKTVELEMKLKKQGSRLSTATELLREVNRSGVECTELLNYEVVQLDRATLREIREFVDSSARPRAVEKAGTCSSCGHDAPHHSTDCYFVVEKQVTK